MRAARIHHVAFRTKRLSAVVRFYRDALGLRVVRVNKLPSGRIRSVWLAIGDGLLMLERAEKAEPDIPPNSNELLCFDARDEKEVARYKKRLARRLDGETPFTIYFRDPDGRRVGISRYRWRP